MPDLALRFHKDVLIVDGAMGTVLQQAGIPQDECGAYLNILDPELIEHIHQRYLMAGAQCITTNTFGATREKLDVYGLADQLVEINQAGVSIARAAGAVHVLADVGPCGLVLEPLGTATFDEVYGQYYEQISALAAAEPDAILIETMTDIADARCAVLAAKVACDLPVMVSCTFASTGRMDLSGTDPATAAFILEAVGADVVGINCGLGPAQMVCLVEEMASATRLPLIVQPNAGIPTLDKYGETVFPGTADEMAFYSEQFRRLGVQFIGSCCGSTPLFSGALYATVGDTDVVPSRVEGGSLVSLASQRAHIFLGVGTTPRIIGERINPTGKPELSAELEAGTMSLVRQLAEAQEFAGADLIDVNVGVPSIDEAEVLSTAVIALSGFVDAPLVFDTTDVEALERALRIYPGRALINSVNGAASSYEKVFPLAKRYGAAVLALALDNEGIPTTTEGRLDIVMRIRAAAHEAGLRDSDLVFDLLTMTAATDTRAPDVTIRSVRAVYEMGLATVLGVSNVSHGLPSRPTLNASFVSLAIAAGLSAAIVNPNNDLMIQAMRSSLYQEDENLFEEQLVGWHQTLEAVMNEAAQSTEDKITLQDSDAESLTSSTLQPADLAEAIIVLKRGILRGDAAAMPNLIDAVIAFDMPATAIVDGILAPTLAELGDAFERGEAFLPQLMIAAHAMKAATERIKDYLPKTSADNHTGTVLFCTVKGDIHSIGKDICIAMLESQGLYVIDLGVDVDSKVILEAVREHHPDVICLSALMTTTLKNMENTVAEIYASFPEYHPEHTQKADARKGVFVGGAVVTAKWADSIGARYTSSAPSCTEAILALLK